MDGAATDGIEGKSGDRIPSLDESCEYAFCAARCAVKRSSAAVLHARKAFLHVFKTLCKFADCFCKSVAFFFELLFWVGSLCLFFHKRYYAVGAFSLFYCICCFALSSAFLQLATIFMFS